MTEWIVCWRSADEKQEGREQLAACSAECTIKTDDEKYVTFSYEHTRNDFEPDKPTTNQNTLGTRLETYARGTIHNLVRWYSIMRLAAMFCSSHHIALRGSEKPYAYDREPDELNDEDANTSAGLKHPRAFYWLNLAFFLVSSTMFILTLKPSRSIYGERMPEHLKQVSMLC